MSSACGREENEKGEIWERSADPIGSKQCLYLFSFSSILISIANQFNAVLHNAGCYCFPPLSNPSIARQPPALAGAQCVQHLLQQHKKSLF